LVSYSKNDSSKLLDSYLKQNSSANKTHDEHKLAKAIASGYGITDYDFDPLNNEEPQLPVSNQITAEDSGIVVIQKIGIKMKCTHTNCGYEWVYTGNPRKRLFCCCPSCHSSVKLPSKRNSKEVRV
jgi:hypothetical protein